MARAKQSKLSFSKSVRLADLKKRQDVKLSWPILLEHNARSKSMPLSATAQVFYLKAKKNARNAGFE